ncbi:radical SAM protein [Marinilabiliaceae bacterium N1Y90]|nr:radical SAM protein [Marinilabiliaceae bacterium N1Y90]
MEPKVLLVTPPLTQLNTPYPATCYLKGYLNTIGVACNQVDLGIEVINHLFSYEGLSKLFEGKQVQKDWSENSQRIFHLKKFYLASIPKVMDFLHEPKVEMAHVICSGNVLPEASRFEQLEELEWAFGNMGLLDKAKHFCTLYLEDICDFITEVIDPHFGFSRYAERLGRSASSFDSIDEALNLPLSYVEEILIKELSKAVNQHQPTLISLSVPFPGNLMGALRIGQWIKQNQPEITVSMGGGYPNTELRALKDDRIFQYLDFITLDDGETPLKRLIEYLSGQCDSNKLVRTWMIENGELVYLNDNSAQDVPQEKLGTPDYSDLPLHKYLSVIEVANPMFRLWSDGKWMKLTLAHGCYWGKCTFCDGSLDYIGRYEPSHVKMIVDRMQAMMLQTGMNGFHFVDEAAPPALLKELALEILRRQIRVVWWTNVRFEKSFTPDVCRLLKLSGCIAVSGGIEVASERILKLINKGVDIAQVSNVSLNFTQAGIMVHAYLMYGFPTQTEQETIDSLEVVRQLFELNIIDSGFWHQFAMTAHSDVGLQPDKYKVKITKGLDGEFANNDLYHQDPLGADHSKFGEGLKKAIFNFMHGVCLDYHLSEWFEFKAPQTSLPPNYIEKCLSDSVIVSERSSLVWLHEIPLVRHYEKRKKGSALSMAELTFVLPQEQYALNLKANLADWLLLVLSEMSLAKLERYSLNDLHMSFEAHELGDFDVFWQSNTCTQLREIGLLIL